MALHHGSAIVILLDETDRLTEHAAAIATLATRHREKFFDVDAHIVTGSGSSWWDSSLVPREAYNTFMLLSAIERLEEYGIDTPYTGAAENVRNGLMNSLWNGNFYEEYRGSSVMACDANVIPLYFDLVDDNTANRLVSSLTSLQTETGLKMRERPFTVREVRPVFLLHRDYHYHVWPWNSFMYANGLRQYGFDKRAEREVERIEHQLRSYGKFLEILTLDGAPYVKRGYASAEDFTVATALWVEYKHQL